VYAATLQQHIATHYCNTLLQHTTATHYCNTLLQHTTAIHYCNAQLRHTTAAFELQHNKLTHQHIHASTYQHINTSTHATGWRRIIECLIFVGRFPQRNSIISGSFAKRDLQLKALLCIFAILNHMAAMQRMLELLHHTTATHDCNTTATHDCNT